MGIGIGMNIIADANTCRDTVTYIRTYKYIHTCTNKHTNDRNHTNATYSTYTYKHIRGSVRINFIIHSREVQSLIQSRMYIHKIMHKQTNGHAQTMHACIRTQIVRTWSTQFIRIQKYEGIHTEFTSTLTYTPTHTRACIHRHMDLHTKSIDRELVRPIHVLRV